MSERTRHAAELAGRLWVACERTHGKPTFPNYGRLGADVDKLLRLQASLRGLAERECSDPRADFSMVTDPEKGNREFPQGREAKRRNKLENAAVSLLWDYGLRCDFNRDPRGSSIYIHFPDGAYNTLGGRETGWGV